MVEDVEEVGGNLDFEALVERSCFAEARVEIPEAQAAERMTGAIAAVASEEWVPEISGCRGRIPENVYIAGRAECA